MKDLNVNTICDRCGSKLVEKTKSWFNSDILCIECARKESRHPEYKEARGKINKSRGLQFTK